MVDEKKKETGNQSSDAPLVFISHDNRDAELAEAFSKLLKSVSAGMLKSFRSALYEVWYFVWRDHKIYTKYRTEEFINEQLRTIQRILKVMENVSPQSIYCMANDAFNLVLRVGKEREEMPEGIEKVFFAYDHDVALLMKRHVNNIEPVSLSEHESDVARINEAADSLIEGMRSDLKDMQNLENR